LIQILSNYRASERGLARPVLSLCKTGDIAA